MIIHTISHYLEAHKRLVIPQLGTFVVKEPGKVLFTELLKRDDGVLRGVLCEEGIGEMEAAGEIDRFVFEVRHAVENRAEYRMGGLGLFRRGPNGMICFVSEPCPAESEPMKQQPRHEQVAEAVRTAFSEVHLSSSAKLNPDSCLKGLRYGKPHKYANAYAYAGRTSRRGMDRFLLVAIAAAVIAVGAIAFGYYRSGDKQAEAEQTEQVEQTPQTENSQPQQPAKK